MKWRNSKERELLSSKVPQLFDDNDIITAYPIANSSTRETSTLSLATNSTPSISATSTNNNNIEMEEKHTMPAAHSNELELEQISDCGSDFESGHDSDNEDHLEID